MRRYVAAVLSLRRTAFLLGAAAVVLLAFPRTPRRQGVRPRRVAAGDGGHPVCVWFQISASIRVLALRLDDRYGRSYRAEMAGGVSASCSPAALVAAGAAPAWLGVLAAAAGAAGWPALAPAARRADLAGGPASTWAPTAARSCATSCRRLPSALYFSVQGPLMIWLAATFGSTRNIAEVGALGRLGLVVGIFSSLTGVVFLPRLARIMDERLYRAPLPPVRRACSPPWPPPARRRRRLPEAFLFVLGPALRRPRRELLLVVAGAGLTLLDGYCVSVNLARSWTRWEGLAVIVLIAVQAVLVAVLPLSTTSGVLVFNLLTAATGLLLQVAISVAGFVRPGWVQWMT